MSYASIYKKSIEQPESFWAEAAESLVWFQKWTQVLDSSNPPFYQWFKGGQLNTCYNALDRHVEEGRGEQAALIYDSPVTQTKRTYTYTQLRDEVSKFAGVLAGLGVHKGDRVIIYMPMIPEAVMAMLACARIGAIHSVVFGGFAANELATRIDDALPKVIISASCGIEVQRVIPYKPLLDEAINRSAHKPDACVIVQRPQVTASLVEGRDYDYATIMQDAKPAPCVPVNATDPLYILYTSGTTGLPKGIVRDNGGHAVALLWSMKNIYNVQPGEVFWAASDVGWVVGHSYIVYAPLLNGSTTLLYEGKPVGTPDAGAFWRVIEEHKVGVLFTAPTAIRAIKRDDPNAAYLSKYDLSNFRTLFLAGERCDPDTLHWSMDTLKRPVIDHWWQTETGWPISANCLGIEMFEIRAGSATKPVPGYDVRVLDAGGEEKADGDIGNIVVKLPMPPGCLPTLWNNDTRFVNAYMSMYEGYYLTGDAGYKDTEGYLWIMSRIDDIINVAGHRLSTGAMEEVLSAHPDVAECAVFGIHDNLKGELPMGLLVLKSGVTRPHADIEKEVIKMVRDQIGPVAAFKLATTVERLPKTRSGKILRGTLKKIADGESYRVPATIDDPSILTEIADQLAGIGFPKPA
jgi:propionyl-CoA synthetase